MTSSAKLEAGVRGNVQGAGIKAGAAYFDLSTAHKDVSLATALGRDLGVPMRMCNLALAEMTEALNRGWEGRDSRSVMLLQQERAGVRIAVDPQRLKQATDAVDA
jgi:3-hydroxyisobutyrate dehydrogenase-like beta-hydroxyacid dehydrogenase